MDISRQHVCLIPVEARRGSQMPWNWRATMWVLETKLRSSATSVGTSNH